MRISRMAICITVSALTGCSMLPYENDYSCRLKDNYGKCISVESAYTEAVTGESQGEPMKPKSKQGFGRRKKSPENSQMAQHSGSAYENYRDRTYHQLGELIKQPNTPLLQPPKIIRTLVVSYSSSSKQDTLYMPRYVYTVVQDPKWVLGQYLHGKPELIQSLVDTREVNS